VAFVASSKGTRKVKSEDIGRKRRRNSKRKAGQQGLDCEVGRASTGGAWKLVGQGRQARAKARGWVLVVGGEVPSVVDIGQGKGEKETC